MAGGRRGPAGWVGTLLPLGASESRRCGEPPRQHWATAERSTTRRADDLIVEATLLENHAAHSSKSCD